MTFQRARTDEQRAQRRQQILNAAATMLTEMAVSALSLNELSRWVGLAKANVLRYFESREAVLLDLLDTEVLDWVAELELAPTNGGTAAQRVKRLSEMLTSSLMRRPVLCDLLSAQGVVLEHNISTEVGIRHKRHARHAMQNLAEIVERHLPELGGNNAAALVETTLLMTVAAWQCSRPTEAMQAVYASDPELATMRISFGDVMRRTVSVTASGLLARVGV